MEVSGCSACSKHLPLKSYLFTCGKYDSAISVKSARHGSNKTGVLAPNKATNMSNLRWGLRQLNTLQALLLWS